MSISFDRVSDIYDATRGFSPAVSEQVTDRILEITAANSETHFFEVGVGTGRIAVPIVQRGYAYTGIDISDKMMAELRQKLQGSTNRLTLIQADATSLPFDRHFFDVAVAVHVFHLIPDWRQALAEVRRVLKPDGILLYTDSRNQASETPPRPEHEQSEINQTWRSLLNRYGFQPYEYGAREIEVLQLLQEQGARLETVTAAQWQTEQTVGQILDRYQHKMYSNCWQIPDAVFSPAIADLRDWCLQRYGSLDTTLRYDTQFKMVVVRDWAT